MNEKEAVKRIETGNFNSNYGFDWQLVMDTVGTIGEMMRNGQISEVIRCKNCIHQGKSEKCVLAAIAEEKDVRGLIIHSDQGFQYTSNQYKAICESNGITISMARKGTPIDDAPIENWHALLKKETLYNNNITSLQEYQKLVEEWILFYNTSRLKSKQIRK